MFQWDLVCDQDDLPPLVSTIYFGGFLLGVFSCGYVSDKCVNEVLLTWGRGWRCHSVMDRNQFSIKGVK